MAAASSLCATAASSLLAPAGGAAQCSSSTALFPASVPRACCCYYPRLLLAFRRPAVAAVADPQGVVLEEEQGQEEEGGGQYDDDDYEDGYEGGRGPAFTPPTRPRTGKAALPLKRDRTRSKRFLEIQKLRESKKEYEVPTAISLMKQMSSARFVESAEAHFRMNLDPKYNDQQLRATVNLPKGTGQSVKIAVLTQGEKIDQARAAGADIVGGDDLIEQIKGGFMEFDKLIASPDMMPKVASLGKILGPRGLMPNPKAGTVSPNITQAIEEFKKGKVEYRVDKTGIVHIPFGKADFPEEDLIANFMAVVRSVERNKPSGAKGIYWKTAYLCSSMGPSIKLNIKEMLDYGSESSD
ncbi:50S ribosomal protein L1, chloroplastic [Oryza brachyantha]|uniref:50S ribosomal protein L1, chloroplastic n=1 Tax=Oryza brachyantha TaxID=4533 RepID=UPI001ADCA0CC|nr:50S ribosomal protein L1, chloroplastic [Oryza brachyantha]